MRLLSFISNFFKKIISQLKKRAKNLPSKKEKRAKNCLHRGTCTAALQTEHGGTGGTGSSTGPHSKQPSSSAGCPAL